ASAAPISNSLFVNSPSLLCRPTNDAMTRMAAAQKFTTPESPFVAGGSSRLRAVELAIGELAQSEVPVLVLGEAGSGKRTVARRIHETSARVGEDFRVVGCGELTAADFAEGRR